MIKFSKIVTIVLIMCIVLCSCKKTSPNNEYETENAGGTNYGAAQKSELYIEDFHFLTFGTEKSKVELIAGSGHYYQNNNELLPVYTLNNGDSIAITYGEKNNTVTKATYTFSESQITQDFFEMLTGLGIIKSPDQESESQTTIIPGTETEQTPPSQSSDTPIENNTQTPSTNTQTKNEQHFSSGLHNYTIIEPSLSADTPRSSIISAIGRPSFYFSHTFSADSYIIDCYNLNDGSKLYLDYGFERLRLRCAAIYKNGVYTSVLDTPWSVQTNPEGFTRTTTDRKKLNRLSKNITPAKAYAILGEPSWFEGTRGNYNDIFLLTDGAHAVLNFGSAHNKLSSVSIKETDGKITVIDMK